VRRAAHRAHRCKTPRLCRWRIAGRLHSVLSPDTVVRKRRRLAIARYDRRVIRERVLDHLCSRSPLRWRHRSQQARPGCHQIRQACRPNVARDHMLGLCDFSATYLQANSQFDGLVVFRHYTDEPNFFRDWVGHDNFEVFRRRGRRLPKPVPRFHRHRVFHKLRVRRKLHTRRIVRDNSRNVTIHLVDQARTIAFRRHSARRLCDPQHANQSDHNRSCFTQSFQCDSPLHS